MAEQPTETVPGGITKLKMVLDGHGLYIGNEFRNLIHTARREVFSRAKDYGFSFVCPKVGGYGRTWYESEADLETLPEIASQIGVQAAPFIYTVPDTAIEDAVIAAHIAVACGTVVVDMEDEWEIKPGRDTAQAMKEFGHYYRKWAGDRPVVVTGYGDPITRFGGRWPYQEMAVWVDAYSPQVYYGVWSVYLNEGVEAAFNWAEKECRQVLGEGIHLAPSVSIYGTSGILSLEDIQRGSKQTARFNAPVFWWEYGGVTAEIAQAIRG